MSNDAHLMKRPDIPREWYKPTLAGFSIYLMYSVAFVVGFGYASYALAMSDISGYIKYPDLAILLFLTANGFHLLGWFGHDGVHLCLLNNKYLSVIVGTFVSGAIFFPTIGYGVSHWNHHRFTNQKSDPDANIYHAYRNIFSRAFLGRFKANRRYFGITFALAFNRPVDPTYSLPFSKGWLRAFALFNLACVLFWIGVYTYVAMWNFDLALYTIILPQIIVLPVTGLRFFLEHTSTEAGIFRDTRTYSHPIYTALLFGNNMHLEHHLYPRVPAYNLVKVHKLLKSQGHFERWGSHVVESFFGAWEYVTSKHQYPKPQIDDLEADPFRIMN